MNNYKILTTSFICILIFGCLSYSTGQNLIVSGTVTNSETGDPVEFANIGIEDTYLGTATNMDGNFEIILSQQLVHNMVRISAVGFKSKSYLVNDWIQQKVVNIHLTPENYGISEISVEAKSKIGYGIIRSASNLISDNYIQNSYTYKCYLHTMSPLNGRESITESLFLLTDGEGYKKRSFTNAFQNRNYKIIESSTNEKMKDLKRGMTLIDQVINQDIVRCPGNVLSTESMNDFDVEVLGNDIIDGDSVWVIQYSCKTPTIQNSGDPELVDYKGKIWVNMISNAVMKNSIEATRKGYFLHGNSFKNASDKDQKKVIYKAVTTYSKKENHYILNTINYSLSDNQEKILQQLFLKVVEVSPYDINIVNRQYYNGINKDSVFWLNYKRPVID